MNKFHPQADLIHLGAKFAPCMRKDEKIFRDIEELRRSERETGCCIRNDDSGCVQSSRRECSVRGGLGVSEGAREGLGWVRSHNRV